MSGSIKLLTVGGIAIRMHITFPLILVWAAIQFGYVTGNGWTGALFGVIVVSLLFVIVTLHELGHSFAALNYDVPVKEIVLLPIGGVAQLRRIPENPVQELVIAIAGPAVNFVLAIVMGALAIAAQLPLMDVELLTNPTISFTSIFAYVFSYNLFLGLFNLLPAFPMDGGRVLRALLATRLSYSQATNIAVSVGRGFAWLMGLYGFISGGFFLILIAIFIYLGAGQEGALVQVRSVLRGFKVSQAYSHEVQTLRAGDTLQQAADLTLSSLQASFPVCDEGGNLIGMLPYTNLVDGLKNRNPHATVSSAMISDVKVLSPDMDLFDAQQQLRNSQLDALPVVENGRFLGLITGQDIGEVYRLLSIEPDLLSREALLEKEFRPGMPGVDVGE